MTLSKAVATSYEKIKEVSSRVGCDVAYHPVAGTIKNMGGYKLPCVMVSTSFKYIGEALHYTARCLKCGKGISRDW